MKNVCWIYFAQDDPTWQWAYSRDELKFLSCV